MEYSGIALLESIKKFEVKDGTTFEVIFDDGVTKGKLFEIDYIEGELYWKPNTFKVSMLYNDYYTFKKKNNLTGFDNMYIFKKELHNLRNALIDGFKTIDDALEEIFLKKGE